MNVGQKFFSAIQGAPFIPDIKKLIADQMINNRPTTNWSEGSQLALASAIAASESIGIKLLGEEQYEEFNELILQAQAKYMELSNTSTDQSTLFEGLQKL